MLKIGLTGGIGSGKSAASKYFKKLGAYVFDADAEAKTILVKSVIVQQELIAEFGSDILEPDGNISKQKLGRIAFQDEDHQLRLNAIIHPYLFDVLYKRFDSIAEKNKNPLFVVDGALIFESGLDQHLDYNIVVTSLLKFRLERALKKGTLNRQDIIKRIDLQWTDDEKTGLADFVIKNNEPEKDLEQQVNNIFHQLV
ncbi:MAG: dephospho-CoA kinase [Candidatus Neomarinimicrobiota bacterium]